MDIGSIVRSRKDAREVTARMESNAVGRSAAAGNHQESRSWSVSLLPAGPVSSLMADQPQRPASAVSSPKRPSTAA